MKKIIFTIRRIHHHIIAFWHQTMESDMRTHILIFFMVAVAWTGLLRVAYLAVHPGHFTASAGIASGE